MGKEKRDRYRQWKKMKIRGGGLHMEYDWQTRQREEEDIKK